MVVEDFNNRQLVGPGHGLGDFVVVDKNQLPRNGLDEIALGNNSLQPALGA